MNDAEYYKRQQEIDNRRNRALEKARNRGSMAEAWYNAGNKLTKETIKEFKALMKMADEDFESQKKI